MCIVGRTSIFDAVKAVIWNLRMRRKAANCQPNFRKAVKPDPSKSCGPYKPLSKAELFKGSAEMAGDGAGLQGRQSEEDKLGRELLHQNPTGVHQHPELMTSSAPLKVLLK